ncbi:MAG: hypothetical protein LiPW41_573 [Parcubacteria group bacterium LiPW_41]|nr:MAG: hypothetical protein LiPW41_573 [Parcubacteria group bacterium LiPW_41]
MNGKLKIAIAIIVLLVFVVIGYVVFQNMKTSTTEKEALKKVLNPINGEVVGEKLPKTNPFETKVNPFDSYKNPFEN